MEAVDEVLAFLLDDFPLNCSISGRYGTSVNSFDV